MYHIRYTLSTGCIEKNTVAKMSVLSERLKELRGPTSQSEMARQLDMPRPQWIRYETGKSVPGSDILEKICRTHACSADWLLGLDERGTSVNAGAGAAVAIGANARASVRGTSAAQGERSDCAGCPYKEKMKEFEAFFNATKKKGKKK